jgi:hypothetical protein
MSTEPSYPQDAAVGDSAAGTGGETLGVVVSANESSKAAEAMKGGRNTRNFVAGAAVGVGSAALVAALLYANRSRRGDARADKEPAASSIITQEPED